MNKICKILISFILFSLLLFSKNNKKDQQLNEIKIGIMTPGMKNGGIEKQASLLLQELSKIEFFKFYLLSRKKEIGEYYIPENVTRLVIYNKLDKLKLAKFINGIIKYKIDILIYQNYDVNIVKFLQILKIKVIIFNHSSILDWFYYDRVKIFKELYIYYKNFQLVLSLVPIEGKYIYKKWGINNVITFSNLMSFDIKNTKPSNLSSKNIIMFGRAEDGIKNYHLGVKAMKYIVQKISDAKLFIVSSGKLTYLKNLVEELNIKENVIFTGYKLNLSDILKNSSLHLFLSYAECFPNVLTESKIYGVPTILIGMEYLTLFNGGTVLVENDNPETIANAAIKIINDEEYRKKLGKEARKSIEKFRNEIILKRWVKILKAVYKGEEEIKKIINEEEKLDEKNVYKILDKEITKLKVRKPQYQYLETKNIFNYTYMCSISN